MTLTHKLNHVVEAADLFITFFKSKLRIGGMLASYMEQVQDLENAFWEIFSETDVDTSAGVQLDGLGTIVDEARQGRTDVEYVLALKTRIAINNGNALPEDILETFYMFSEGRTFELKEISPAFFIIRMLDALTLLDPTPTQFNNMLQSIRGGGIKAQFHYTEVDDDATFEYASGDVAEADVDKGWANDAGTIGGSWSDVV